MRALLIVCLLLPQTFLFGQEFEVEGTYQGKNLFVQNPFVDDTTFCVTKVIVNGTVLSDSPSSSAFEIKLDQLGLTLNQPVHIVMLHYPQCRPRILNPSIN